MQTDLHTQSQRSSAIICSKFAYIEFRILDAATEKPRGSESDVSLNAAACSRRIDYRWPADDRISAGELVWMQQCHWPRDDVAWRHHRSLSHNDDVIWRIGYVWFVVRIRWTGRFCRPTTSMIVWVWCLQIHRRIEQRDDTQFGSFDSDNTDLVPVAPTPVKSLLKPDSRADYALAGAGAIWSLCINHIRHRELVVSLLYWFVVWWHLYTTCI